MLTKIQSEKLKRGQINFHQGLNVIVGDPEAKNSIGKSTALMLVDFAFGGKSFYEHDGGAIAELGHHRYYFRFLFEGKYHYFSRRTFDDGSVDVCDSSQNVLHTIDLDEYQNFLKDKYELYKSKGSFRSLVGTYSRIWGKGNDDVSKPLNSHPKQPDREAINSLIDLFGRLHEIAEAEEERKIKEEVRKALNKSLDFNLVPKIDNQQYKQNQKIIAKAKDALEAVQKDFAHAITTYNALFNQKLIDLKEKKEQLLLERRTFQERIARLRRDLNLSTHALSENMRLLVEFFPNANLEKVSKIESFHNKIGKILENELRQDLKQAEENLRQIDAQLEELDSSLATGLKLHNTPADIFEKVFGTKKELDEAAHANLYYEKKRNAAADVRLAKQLAQEVKSNVCAEITREIDIAMRTLTSRVLSKDRQSPSLVINDNSYSFNTAKDTGTGKSYLNLLCLDLAVPARVKVVVAWVMQPEAVYRVGVSGPIRPIRAPG